MHEYDLKVPDGVCRYLSHEFQSCARVIRLAEGGFSAYVFRAHLETALPSGESTVIVKHVEQYAARGFDFKLDPDRLVYEQQSLAIIGALSSQKQWNLHGFEALVGVPSVLHFDDANRLIVLKDIGQHPTLKAWMSASTPRIVAYSVGQMLAHFLANVHDLSTKDPSVLAGFEDNEAGRRLSAYVYYDRLATSAAKYGCVESLVAQAASQAREEVLTAREVLTMGDFWTGNILVCQSVAEPQKLPQVQVIDWELAKPGTAEFDVGQMAAEMYFLMKFKNEESGAAMLEAFLATYSRNRHVDAFRVAMRAGAHMVVIGPMTNPDATEHEVELLVNEGVDFVRAAWTSDESYIRSSVLSPLLK